MRFAGLGSGSAGNGILIATTSANVAVATTVLVDCGFTLQEAIARLARYQIQPPDLQAILVTHEHSDHIGGVERLARRFKIPIYLTRGTYMANRWQKPEELKFNSCTLAPQAIALSERQWLPGPVRYSQLSEYFYVNCLITLCNY